MCFYINLLTSFANCAILQTWRKRNGRRKNADRPPDIASMPRRAPDVFRAGRIAEHGRKHRKEIDPPMKKSLYSLTLMDSVVAEIDRLAARQGTNRSNLVNQILADYVSMMTPEKRIDAIFRHIEALAQQGELVPYVTPNQRTMSLKSSLEYKYRPTIRYELQLYRIPEGAIGELNVVFRTQSQALLTEIEAFLRLWVRLESIYVAKLHDKSPVRYELHGNRFTRSLSLPENRDYSDEQLADAISAYVGMFDDLLKGYITGRYPPAELENRYIAYLNSGTGLI